MDGLSAAASVIAVLQIAQSIGSLLRDMYRNVRHARPQIENLYDCIISLEAIMKGLDSLVGRRGMGMINAALLEDAQGPLKRALCELQIAKKKLDVRAVGDSLFGKMKPSFKESVKRSFHWPFAKEEVLAIVEKLENYKSSLLMDVTINTLSIQFQQNDILHDIKNDLELAQTETWRQRVIGWLSRDVPDPSFEHNIAIKKHAKTTGSWLVNGDDLKRWLTAPNSYLWIHGNAGAGKSILCSTIIAHVQEICKNEPNWAFGYWYFTFRNPSSQKIDQFLRSLIINLCSQRRDTPLILEEEYTQANVGNLSPSTNSLMNMLNSVLDGFENVYILLDALDECPKRGTNQNLERDELLERIHEICSWNNPCLHILTTSRKEKDIEESLTDLSNDINNFQVVDVHGRHVEHDIRTYIESKLAAHQFKTWQPALKAEVQEKLATQADGMFRLVALQLHELLRSTSIAKIKRALNNLPRTLDEFYDRILREIPEDDRHRASVALQWLAFSPRPLSLPELAEAIIIDARQPPYLDPEERFMDSSQILDFLPAGLVRTAKPKPKPKWKSKDSDNAPLIEFSHFSVLEYLKSTRMSPDLLSMYHIEDIKAHRMIAESCLAYILHIGDNEQPLAEKISRFFRSTRPYTREPQPDDSFVLKPQKSIDSAVSYALDNENICMQLDSCYVLAAYANTAWHYHLTQLGDFREGTVSKLALDFLTSSNSAWLLWCYFFFVDYAPVSKVSGAGFERPELDFPKSILDGFSSRLFVNPVIWVCWLGLPDLLGKALQDCPDMSKLEATPCLGSALHAASFRGHLKIVQMLLAAHADPNQLGGYFDTPLKAAAAGGFDEIIKILKDTGAPAD